MGEKRLDWEPVAGELVLRWLARDWSVREVSKRVLLLLYAFFPDQRWRPQMARSLHAIGETLGLTATNKRSAVSAAMQSQVLPLMRGLGGGAAVKLWFMKNPGCRAALSVAMKGKQNRKRKEDAVDLTSSSTPTLPRSEGDGGGVGVGGGLAGETGTSEHAEA